MGLSKKKLLIGLSILLIFVYLIGVFYFSQYTFPNTFINSNEKGLTIISDVFKLDDEEFIIKIEGRDSKTLKINLNDINYKVNFEGKPEIKQNNYLWPIEILKKHDYKFSLNVSYNEDKLSEILKESDMNKNIIEPENAEIIVEDDKVYIKEEEKGNKLDQEKFLNTVKKSIDSKIENVILNDEYYSPEISKDDKKLNEKYSLMKQIFVKNYVFDFEDKKYELTGKALLDIFSDTDSGYKPDKDKIEDYVMDLAMETNTYAKPRQFNATGIGEITVPAGVYGWRMDVEDTTENLINMINENKDGNVDIVYIQEAAQRGKNDIGDTYVEIDLSRQHMWFYKDGELVIDTDIVSGDLRSKIGPTPVGTGIAWAKLRDKVLEGNNAVTGKSYEFPTKYFIPFGYTGAGIHDNDVRTRFGGDIYKTEGSSSCVNTPPKVMKVIFDNLPINSAVVVYESSTNFSPTDFERYSQLNHEGN